MKKIKQLLSVAILLTVYIPGFSQGYHVRIGFVGNSITMGAGLPNSVIQCYPAQLAVMLQEKFGDTCIVGNFAVSGRTMLKHGDYPIWNEPLFKDGWKFAPNILFIMLGTNDSKYFNWDDHKGEFFGDYKSMIDTFKKRNPDTKFILCLPPPAYKYSFYIRDSVIINGVIPLVDSVAKVTGSDTMDFYHPLLDSISIFQGDGIHPSVHGSAVMAKMDFDKLIRTDLIHQVDTTLTFITSFKTLNQIVRDDDTAILSWTTANADSVYLNGDTVSANGSMKVNAKTTTVYTLVAKGKYSSDTLTLTQVFYHPFLTRISIFPGKKTINLNDSLLLSARLLDQYGKLISDSLYPIDWIITDGNGKMIDGTTFSAKFVATDVDTVSITADLDTISSNVATIIVKSNTNIQGKVISDEKVNFYPNPVNDKLSVSILTSQPTQVSIKLYDLKGVMQLEDYSYITSYGEHTFTLLTKGLASGVYLYQVEYSGKQFKGKINIVKK